MILFATTLLRTHNQERKEAMNINMPISSLVIYRTDGRNGLVYDLPAIVTCTKESHPGDYPCEVCGGVEEPPVANAKCVARGHNRKQNPLPVPLQGCVHITVFTPGGFGSRVPSADDPSQANSEDFLGADTFIPGSGTYVEWNVPVWQFPGDWQEMLAFDRNKVPHRTVRSFI